MSKRGYGEPPPKELGFMDKVTDEMVGVFGNVLIVMVFVCFGLGLGLVMKELVKLY